MLIVVVLIPFLAVKSCSVAPERRERPEKESAATIRVYVKGENRVRVMPFEEYIKGVVAAEMPAEFEPEALKAQAVAARTYAYARMKGLYRSSDKQHADADICTDPGHCQAWISQEKAMKKWNIFTRYRNWRKIEKAVNDTSGIIITYNGVVANPLFHSNSGGRTENAEDVWDGVDVPYLKSVPSNGEEGNPEFRNSVLVKNSDFIKKMESRFPGFKIKKDDIAGGIRVLEYTAGGRVKRVQIGNTVMKGTDFRALFALKSANFKVERKDGETLEITTLGYGHGVGMSQWGANYLAKNGGSFEEILRYYYKGVELSSIGA